MSGLREGGADLPLRPEESGVPDEGEEGAGLEEGVLLVPPGVVLVAGGVCGAGEDVVVLPLAGGSGVRTTGADLVTSLPDSVVVVTLGVPSWAGA